MPPLKFELHSLPELVERNDRLWFKLKLDSKSRWQPDRWREPLDEALIQSVLDDASFSSETQKAKRLQALSGSSARLNYSRSLRRRHHHATVSRYQRTCGYSCGVGMVGNAFDAVVRSESSSTTSFRSKREAATCPPPSTIPATKAALAAVLGASW